MTAESQSGVDFFRLIERRRKFIEGLDANRGEINLDIFEDFYPDRAHFVYELLQNAEDAGATEVVFTLQPDRLVCEHDGRPFTLEDVRSITGLHDSTKANAQDKIGKFGVGFKSVFVYTQAPSIQSGAFAFRIVQLILPEQIAPDSSLGRRTRFEFPFDNGKKSAQDSYAEVAAGVKELDEKTLLFLSSLQSIKWRVGTNSGVVSRRRHSDFHFEVLKEVGGATSASSHFLKFEEAVSGLERQRVAVAFALDLVPGVRQFEDGKPLGDQFKIISATPGSVAVFFPAAKESSGLRFHLHGPFVPELSRASIKETKANLPLFEQLAVVASGSLHRIKDLGLLTSEFLSVLPNPQDEIPARYQRIRTAIIEEMKSQPLTPTYSRKHAAASRLIQARASLKDLLSESDVDFLVDYDDEPPLWAIGVTQRNSRIDHFLSGLDIRTWGLDEFIGALREKASDEEGLFPKRPDEKFLSWFENKSPAWAQEFYGLLHSEASNETYLLKTLRIVRLADGSLSRANHAFFGGESAGDNLPIVDKAVYTSGTSKQQQEGAKRFLADIGVREIGEAEQIELILEHRYAKDAKRPGDIAHFEDLRRFVALAEKQPEKAKLFAAFNIFCGEDGGWRRPGAIYLDQPYLDTGLSAYYRRLNQEAEPLALHSRYLECGIDSKRLGKFAQAAGAKADLQIEADDCQKNRDWQYLFSVGGNWTSTGINRDYFIPKLEELLKTPSLDLSRLVWRTLISLPSYPNYFEAIFRRNASHGARFAPSRLVHELRVANWVPQGDGLFVHPADASRELLPKGFPFDTGYTWLKAIQFGETAVRESAQALQKEAAARSLGFADAAAAERAKRFNDLPIQDQEKILAELESRTRSAVPDRPLANPERRAQNVRAQALKAPDKESEVRPRSVSIGREEVKEQADTYLREHYRNADGEMTCQICKGPLPFKLDDGREYFEVVEFLSELRKRHPQNYLALCPNHSAMYRLVNGSKETMREDLQGLMGNELSVVLAERDMTIYFSKTHIIDLKAILEAEQSLPSDGPMVSVLAEEKERL